MPENKPVPATSCPWSENMRGIVSVLLVAHLFGLGLVFLANNDFNPRRNSAMLDKTKQAIDPYLFALWFDRMWDNRIANGDEADADHAIRFLVRGPDGKPVEAARFPALEGNSPEERERWQQFANNIARTEDHGGDMSGFERQLTLLAKSWLAQQRAAGTPYDSVTIEIRRRNRVSLDGDLTANPLAPQYYPPPPYGEGPNKILQPVEVYWPNGEGEPFLRKLGGEKRDQSPVVPSTTSTPKTTTPAVPTPMNTPTPMPNPMTPAEPMPATTPLPVAPPLVPAPQPVTPPAIDAPSGK